MIGFKIDGEFLDMEPNFALPFVWESSLFSDEFSLTGFSTLPITLPFTDKNKRLLQYFNLVAVNIRNAQFNAELYLGGNYWSKGVLTVNVKGESFDCDFSEITGIAVDADKKLKDIFSDVYINVIPDFARYWVVNFDASLVITKIQFRFFVNNSEHIFSVFKTGDDIADMDTLFDQVMADSDMIDIFNISRESGPEELILFTVKNEKTIDKNANIYIKWDEGCRASSKTYGPGVDWMSTQKNNISDKISDDVNKYWPDVNHCFPTIWNEQFYADKHPDNPNNMKLINYFKENYPVNTNTSSSTRNKYSISPQVFLGAFLTELSKKYGLSISGNFTQLSGIFNKVFIYNNTALDITGIDPLFPPSGSHFPVNFWRGRYKLSDHLPDCTLKEFFSAIKNFFCVGVFIKTGQLEITTRKSIISSPESIDWTSKVLRVIDEIYSNSSAGYLMKYKTDSSDSTLAEIKEIEGEFIGQFESVLFFPTKNISPGQFAASKESKNLAISKYIQNSGRGEILWTFYCPFLHDYNAIQGESELDSGVSQTLNKNYQETEVRIMNLPCISQLGSSMEYELGLRNPPTRFLLYHGLRGSLKWVTGSSYSYSEDADVLYPFASMDNLNMNVSLINAYKLRFEDEDGLYQTLHKEWAEFIQRDKKVSIQVVLFKYELIGVDLSKKIRIGESVFFIEKIQGNLSSNKDSVICKVDLRKL